jgi:hypothetical protein
MEPLDFQNEIPILTGKFNIFDFVSSIGFRYRVCKRSCHYPISLYDKDPDNLLMSTNKVISSVPNDPFKTVYPIGEDTQDGFE